MDNPKKQSLTEHEIYGLAVECNLADGHSYISAKKHFNSVLCDLPGLWDSAAETPIPQMEKKFKNIFAEYFSLFGLKAHEHFSVCPTASNSIDIVGAWAQARSLKVGLIEPTFDNLAQLLRRRGVELEAIPESVFADPGLLENSILEKNLDALFLVNPNNPTGAVVDAVKMSKIVDLCLRHNVILLFDVSFRFCHREIIDEYALLIEKGASFIILEDTGKQWPTLDAKASLLSYSEDLADEIRLIYEELYLCCSNFTLSVITAFIEATLKKGGVSYMQALIDENQKAACSALSGTLVHVETLSSGTPMTVLWLNIKKTGLNDLELTDYLAGYEIAVLPGRYFYWNTHEVAGHDRIRIALMKPDKQLRLSLACLRKALLDLEHSRISIGVDVSESQA